MNSIVVCEQGVKMASSHVFGLTGGIACGKSTVARYMTEFGAHVIDADQISRDVMQLGTEGHRLVLESFGPNILEANGAISRAKLGEKVFADDEARAHLESILHPLIAAESGRRISQAQNEGAAVILYEAALLIESGRADMFRPLVVVWSEPSLQRARIRKRDHLSDPEIEQRLKSQMPIDKKRTFGDFILENNGSLIDLRSQTKRLWHTILDYRP